MCTAEIERVGSESVSSGASWKSSSWLRARRQRLASAQRSCSTVLITSKQTMSPLFKSHKILTPHQRPRINLHRLNKNQKCSNHQSGKELFLIRHQRSSLKRSVISTSLSNPRLTRKLCSFNNKSKAAKAQALLCPSLNYLNSLHHSCKATHQQPQKCFRAPM